MSAAGDKRQGQKHSEEHLLSDRITKFHRTFNDSFHNCERLKHFCYVAIGKYQLVMRCFKFLVESVKQM